MEHPIGHFVTPLYGESKHPKGAQKMAVIIAFQKVFMKHLCFYSELLERAQL